MPEGARFGTPDPRVVVDRDDVAPGAESAFTGAGEQNRVHGIVVFPLVERVCQRCHHRMGQRVDGLRPVQDDLPGAVHDAY